MKELLMLLLLSMASVAFAGSLHAYDDNSRKREVTETNKSEGYPTKMPNGVFLHGYIYNADLDAMVLVLIADGWEGKATTAKTMRDHWNGQVGQALKKKGFRDFAVSWTNRIDGKQLIFSPRFNKWMSADDYLRQK